MTSEVYSGETFEHIPIMYRAKVLNDLISHLAPDKTWDFGEFDPANDYQRHLYALFLRLAGYEVFGVSVAIYKLSSDVKEEKRARYVSMLVHSEIVGFPFSDGTLIKIPDQVMS